MIKDQVNSLIYEVLKELSISNNFELPSDLEIELTYPKQREHGDFATNVAMKLAKPAGMKPRDLAALLVEHLMTKPLFAKVEVAGPGFINLTLAVQAWHETLGEVFRHSDNYGKSAAKNPQKVLIEFVSANPTGPLHVGHGRGAILGDTVAALLQWTGHTVEREFYVNDAGNQVRNLGLSLQARYRRYFGVAATIPGDGYHNDYLIAVAEKLATECGDKYIKDESEAAVAFFTHEGITRLRTLIESNCAALGIRFDHWISEKSLHASGAVPKALEFLKTKGDAYENDGAWWFKAEKYGDEKDRVIVKSTGEHTYLLSDIAYHKDKLNRGFTRLINIWGADHHGYIPRVKAAIQALGLSPESLDVVLTQMVSIKRGGEMVKLSKRGADSNAVLDKNVPNGESTFIALGDLTAEIGKDALRVFFLQRDPNSSFEFDVDLAKKQSNDNPVFYVQYGHARCSAILRKATSVGIPLPNLEKFSTSVLSPLINPEELYLISELSQFPEVVIKAADNLSPSTIFTYLQEMISSFHSYYTVFAKKGDYIISSDPEKTMARLYLVLALKQVLYNGLSLLGVFAPESMEEIES